LTRTAAPRLGAYAGLSAAGLLAALVLGRPELVVLAAPFAVVVAIGLLLAEQPRLRVSLALDRERALEGEEVEVAVEVESTTPVERLELYVALPASLELLEGSNPVALRLGRGERRRLVLRTRAARWGGVVVERIHIRARDRFGLLTYEVQLRQPAPLRVYPREEALRSIVTAMETQATSGNEVSRRKGEGIEFADIREFNPGDRIRRINWRASARRGGLWVNESHPERNTDVILFLDSFTDLPGGGGRSSSLDLAVRATATLAAHYIERRDRVGLIAFGGVLRWLLPGMGVIQLYRIVEALLDTEIVLNYAWKDIDVIPARTLPPASLVLALTPLIDDRAVGSLLDLRARGFDLAVVEVSPVPFTPPPEDPDDMLAYRLWLLRREALRHRYARAGVAVAEWLEGEPFQAPLEEVRAFRRHVRHGHA